LATAALLARLPPRPWAKVGPASDIPKGVSRFNPLWRTVFFLFTPASFLSKKRVHQSNTSGNEVKLAPLNTSIVVLAQANNPSFLHPAALSADGIVPKEWELADAPICTPAVSVVKYKNGIVFTSELSRLMIRDDMPRQTTPISRLAAAWFEKLPTVHFSDVGINFGGFVECSNPGEWIIERFLKKGPGNDDKSKLNAAGLKLVYALESGELNLSCDAATFQKPGDPIDRPCLMINGNYNVRISGHDTQEQARAAVGLFGKRLAHFAEMTESVFGLEREACLLP